VSYYDRLSGSPVSSSRLAPISPPIRTSSLARPHIEPPKGTACFGSGLSVELHYPSSPPSPLRSQPRLWRRTGFSIRGFCSACTTPLTRSFAPGASSAWVCRVPLLRFTSFSRSPSPLLPTSPTTAHTLHTASTPARSHVCRVLVPFVLFNGSVVGGLALCVVGPAVSVAERPPFPALVRLGDAKRPGADVGERALDDGTHPPPEASSLPHQPLLPSSAGPAAQDVRRRGWPTEVRDAAPVVISAPSEATSPLPEPAVPAQAAPGRARSPHAEVLSASLPRFGPALTGRGMSTLSSTTSSPGSPCPPRGMAGGRGGDGESGNETDAEDVSHGDDDKSHDEGPPRHRRCPSAGVGLLPERRARVKRRRAKIACWLNRHAVSVSPRRAPAEGASAPRPRVATGGWRAPHNALGSGLPITSTCFWHTCARHTEASPMPPLPGAPMAVSHQRRREGGEQPESVGWPLLLSPETGRNALSSPVVWSPKVANTHSQPARTSARGVHRSVIRTLRVWTGLLGVSTVTSSWRRGPLPVTDARARRCPPALSTASRRARSSARSIVAAARLAAYACSTAAAFRRLRGR